MNGDKTTSAIFTIKNVQILDSGLSAKKKWGPAGGIIGSDPNADWVLTDATRTVIASHCEIVLVDGSFCLRDLCGSTYLNGSKMPLGMMQLARLRNKDEITIGPYIIRVVLEAGDFQTINDESLASLLDMQSESLLGDMVESKFVTLVNEPPAETNVEPLAALESQLPQEDSFSLLDDAPDVTERQESPQQQLIPDDNLTELIPKFSVQADSDFEITSSLSLAKIMRRFWPLKQNNNDNKDSTASPGKLTFQEKQIELNQKVTKISEGSKVEKNVLDLLEEEVAKSIDLSEHIVGRPAAEGMHLLTGPILNGIGVDISYENDMERMHFLSQELGESLQACVKGLLQIHAQAQNGLFGVMNRNLQPIEDNPLRLGLSYEKTIQTLYDGDQSLVHLSAPSAIKESLSNILAHNEAIQHATSEALIYILNAFSPEILVKRFQNYRHSANEAKTTNEDAWAWEMYRNYYLELTSNRQKGFEKLFWEIFEQVYDKKIREKQLEC